MMRRPFITSVTLLATACGASSTDAEPNDSAAAHDAAEADVVSADSPPDAAEGCPAERPIYGGSCSVPKTSRCTYADPCPLAPSAGGTDTFECLDHIWTVPVTGTYAIPCPTPLPSPGDACLCAAHMPVGCIVAACPDLAPEALLVCDDATKSWSAQEMPCNPTKPDADIDADDADAGD